MHNYCESFSIRMRKGEKNTSLWLPFCYRRPLRPEGIFWTVVGLIYQLCGGSSCQPVSCTFNLVSTGSHQLKRLISPYIPHLSLLLPPSLSFSVCLSLSPPLPPSHTCTQLIRHVLWVNNAWLAGEMTSVDMIGFMWISIFVNKVTTVYLFIYLFIEFDMYSFVCFLIIVKRDNVTLNLFQPYCF